ncbi:hypothetical protein BLA29_012900 [Euroglyphus maynei]|uniref:Uncharacterized protein n=1 Tax=Euroglyphus maynei TaxID=6958 RepID=A0A1Y3ATV7_EURMA|nr:hypothetical protein BLA29_012900 [Euroglyphus maynei]
MVPIDGGYIGNCKGINYSIENFLGPNTDGYYPDYNPDWSLKNRSSSKRLFACHPVIIIVFIHPPIGILIVVDISAVIY